MPFRSSKELWEHLDGFLSKMSSQSSFCFQGGLQVKKDLIQELLKNLPDDSLDMLYVCQTILCRKDRQVTLNGFEKTLLKQKSRVLGFLFNDARFEEADTQNSIRWTIGPKIFRVFLESLSRSNILDEQKELNEQKKEKMFIKLLDQAKKDFLMMFVRKEAASSCQIEATMIYAIETEADCHTTVKAFLQRLKILR